ncbi:MAG: ROK family protein [Deltaproteobacteria bacterium]|nr:ROK family protein [Deltaproteobacteria bacterium]
MSAQHAVGIDLGGSNLRAARVELTSSTIEQHHREPVGEPRDPQTIVAKVARVVERLSPGAPVGIGIAAMLSDREGTVANSPHLRWRDVPFGRLLAARLGDRYPLTVTNDVNAIIWGEHVAGAARGCRDVLGVYVGTGIGGGVIANGALVEGVTNCAGEIGHTKVRWDREAAPCECGQRGCIEAYVGGSYLLARIARETGTAGTPADVDRLAAAGDPWASALWAELAPLLSITLGNAVSLLNCERLVLGGGVLSRTPALVALVKQHMAETTNGPSWGPLSVVQAELGDDAGLVGAAHLAATTRPSPVPRP